VSTDHPVSAAEGFRTGSGDAPRMRALDESIDCVETLNPTHFVTMPATGATRKRPRKGQASPIDLTGPEVGESCETNSARALRADLTLRSSESILHAAFAGAAHVGEGALNTDAFLCQLGQDIAAALTGRASYC